MTETEATVVANRAAATDHFELTLSAPEIARAALPGQFVHVRCSATTDPLLCRPLSVAGTDQEAIRLIYQVVGRGTELLARGRPGDTIALLGPLGRGFSAPSAGSGVVFVAGGVGVAPLIFLGEWLGRKAEGVSVTALVGARRADLLLGVEALRAAGAEVLTATDDGSAGHQGFAAELLASALEGRRADRVYACGPEEMLRKAAELCAEHDTPCEVGLETRMGCGVGACLGCVVRTRGADGEPTYARVCRDGPVFNAAEVVWP